MADNDQDNSDVESEATPQRPTSTEVTENFDFIVREIARKQWKDEEIQRDLNIREQIRER